MDGECLSRKYGKCLSKIAKYRNHVAFSGRCKKTSIVPPSLGIKSPVLSTEGWKIVKRAGMIFVNEKLCLANCCPRELEKEKKHLELNLGRMINVGKDHDMVRRIS